MRSKLTVLLGRSGGGEEANWVGQISASLASLSRIVEDYDSMARRELVPAKQEKAFTRVKLFRKEIQEYRTQFEKLKGEKSTAVRIIQRKAV